MASNRDVERFLRTLRVTMAVALAEHDLDGAQAARESPTRFLALAAKAGGSVRFPPEGITSSDGLVLARLQRGESGQPVEFELQALGAAGLAAFAGLEALVHLPSSAALACVFDRDGRAVANLESAGLDEDECCSFSISLTGEDA